LKMSDNGFHNRQVNFRNHLGYTLKLLHEILTMIIKRSIKCFEKGEVPCFELIVHFFH
jgi:hypothetical protein